MKYRKKPVVIEAQQFFWADWVKEDMVQGQFGVQAEPKKDRGYDFIIPTLEGNLLVSEGDWIIKGVKGEFYPCKPDIFEMTYERIDDER